MSEQPSGGTLQAKRHDLGEPGTFKAGGASHKEPSQHDTQNIQPEMVAEQGPLPVEELSAERVSPTPLSSSTASIVNVPIGLQNPPAVTATTAPTPDGPDDYFGLKPSPQSTRTAAQPFLTLPVPCPGDASGESHGPPPQSNTDPSKAPSPAGVLWTRASPQVARPPTSDPAITRPVSVPDFPTIPLSTPQHAQENAAKYPDQALASLGQRSHPPPPPTRMGRTHSSHSPHWSQSWIKETPVKEGIPSHNGARTAGNTPAQSPGLDSPSIRSPSAISKKHGPESEERRPTSHVLQASHLGEPIETHKLNKDIDPISGRKVLNNYELIEKLGSGQHGTVKRGRNMKTKDPVAVKIVRRFSKKVRLGKTGDPSDSIKKEVAILKKARHPHVVSLYEVIDDPEFDKVYLVLEFVERGEIVWRKKTEKAIGLFEKERIEHEYLHGYDEVFERQAIHEFNAGVETRRKEKTEHLEAQKRQAREQLASGKQSSSLPSHDPFWSLEQGRNAESDLGKPRLKDISHEDVRMSRADFHAAGHPGEAPESATPIYSANTLSQTLQTELSISEPSSKPTSAPSSVSPSQAPSRKDSPQVSRPQTPSLDGTMYGAYIQEKTKFDLEFQQALHQIMADQNETWSYEAEECQYVPCLTLSQASDAFRDTVLGIEYLHYQGIIHRDIKPANLLWTHDYRVKISDFGVSYFGKPMREYSLHEGLPTDESGRHDEAIELAKTVGTPAFYAPELCDPDIFDPDKRLERPPITGQIDVWALGVTLYCMVFGRLPFSDHNEFRMYEKIAREEVFIPRIRLKGVSHTDKTPSNHNKRLDDILEYEEVDYTLRDLLRRLLIKNPAQRISLAEVKQHLWVIGPIEHKDSWLDETDPSRHSEGKKIEVSTQEVQDAVVGLTLLEGLKGVARSIGSIVRGRSSRKRTTSNPKAFDPSDSAAIPRMAEGRRTSLRGDEQILAALKQQTSPTWTREAGEHPLAHSVAATPYRPNREYFGIEGGEGRPHSALEASSNHRPSIIACSMSTADSMKTITARDLVPRQSVLEQQQSTSTEDLASATHAVDQSHSSSSLGGVFGGASRRIARTFRGRERGFSRQSPSQTSRSSSVDTNANTNITEDYHASPSLGFSSAVAAGHVDLPHALQEEAEEYQFPDQPSAESLSHQQRQGINQRQRQRQLEQARHSGAHRRSVSYADSVQYSPSPHDEMAFHQQRPASAADSTFAISSSSDQILSGDSITHSRIPSIVSRASSLSAPIEEESKPSQILSVPRQNITASDGSNPPSALEETISADPAIARAKAMQEEDAGYHGEEEQDSDSEDEGLAMA